jgi:pimeloyl-ACP methyl ester carboxylesterase
MAGSDIVTETSSPYERRRTVRGDGLDLAVWESARGGPTVVLVHGYPDTHVVWDPVADRLAGRLHVVAYDTRGAGASGVPDRVGRYGLRHLVSDLVAVLDAVAPDRPVHLVGHDWGSVQLWDAVVRAKSDPRLTGRIGSYTSISGPCLDHLDIWAHRARNGSTVDRRAALTQAAHSCYAFAFQVPWLPELAVRHIGLRRVLARAERMADPHFASSLVDDACNGLNLYRANLRGRERIAGGPTTEVPVQLLVPLHDRYVTPAVYRDLGEFVPHLTRVDIEAGHWVVRTHPDEVAAYVHGFVSSAAAPPDANG